MATTTKAVLAAENAMLRKQVADLKLDIEMINKLGDQVEATLLRSQQRAAARTQRVARPLRTPAMDAAREIAMRSGCVVKV